MFRFLKNALFRGLVVLIPVVLVYITLRELVQAMIGFATPIADVFPTGWVKLDDPVGLVALVLIILFALAVGLIWSAGPTRRAATWLETRTLYHIPFYRMTKSLVSAFLNMENEDAFKPACWRHDDGSLEPVFAIEKHGKDMLVVVQPWTPTPFAGSIRIVPRDQVEFIQATLDEYSLALTHYGLGLSEAMRNKTSDSRE